jgi:DNA-binding CsgD family transcriptional regulator
MVSILVGASDYPHKSDWSNPVLGTSAQALREYVLSPAGLALTPGRFLDLFDDDASPFDQLLRIADFLAAANTARDLLLYYIGHGGFHGEDDYHLGVRRTQRDREFFTTIESKKLARIIRNEFHRKRVYVFFDSCFAASAASDWQGDEIAVAVRKMSEQLPSHGTAFLAAASKYDVTRAPRTAHSTVFTGAILAALARGVDRAQPRLSVYELYEEVRDILQRRPGQGAHSESMPEIHAPSQGAGDVSLLPLFPNAAYSHAKLVRVADANARDKPVRGPAALSAQERRVLACAKLGHHNKLIGYELGIASSTVRVLLARAAAKLGVRTRRDLLLALNDVSLDELNEK